MGPDTLTAGRGIYDIPGMPRRDPQRLPRMECRPVPSAVEMATAAELREGFCPRYSGRSHEGGSDADRYGSAACSIDSKLNRFKRPAGPCQVVKGDRRGRRTVIENERPRQQRGQYFRQIVSRSSIS